MMRKHSNQLFYGAPSGHCIPGFTYAVSITLRIIVVKGMISDGDGMKTSAVLTLSAIILVFIFIIGPAAASKYDSRESAFLLGYKNSSAYSLLEPRLGKPDLAGFTDLSVKSKTDLVKFDLFEKELWQSIPATGPYCTTCGFNNATKAFGSTFTEDYTSPMSGFFFGGGVSGAGAAGGNGCCG
jgi:hypothetical protein